MFGFDNEKQKLDINLLQAQSYIFYMRYCNLILDLSKKYDDQTYVNISSVLSHYMFNDRLEEIRLDGLGSYYKIYWIKSKANLYRCYDGCTGGKNIETEFNKVIQNCFSHISGGYNTTQYLSFSKSFGRVMLKYFNPQKQVTIDNITYNIEIIKSSPINCFLSMIK